MQLRKKTLGELALVICGDDPFSLAFPYRSSSKLNRFFSDCELDFVHDGSTRRLWVEDRLAEINDLHTLGSQLPSAEITRVIVEIVDSSHFRGAGAPDQAEAIGKLNEVLRRDGLRVVTCEDGSLSLLTSDDAATTHSSNLPTSRPLTAEEVERRRRIESILDTLSEDQFTTDILLPLFQGLGFRRVTVSGHREKIMEFGRDLWMKYELPTGHWLYFSAQIKREKIDSAGKKKSGNTNISEVLSQARMAMDNTIFDPEANRYVLLDHLFIISANTITRAARHWLVANLDQDQRRTLIFMDRHELLDHAARIAKLPLLEVRLAGGLIEPPTPPGR